MVTGTAKRILIAQRVFDTCPVLLHVDVWPEEVKVGRVQVQPESA